MLENFQQYLIDLSQGFGVSGLGFAVVNFFSYLCVLATYMNIKYSEMSQVRP